MQYLFALALGLTLSSCAVPELAHNAECKNPGDECSASSDCCWKNQCVGGICKDGDPKPSGPE